MVTSVGAIRPEGGHDGLSGTLLRDMMLRKDFSLAEMAEALGKSAYHRVLCRLMPRPPFAPAVG